jgi:hypothetical protein
MNIRLPACVESFRGEVVRDLQANRVRNRRHSETSIVGRPFFSAPPPDEGLRAEQESTAMATRARRMGSSTGQGVWNRESTAPPKGAARGRGAPHQSFTRLSATTMLWQLTAP